MTTWDCGGRCPLRPLWRHYYQGCQGLVFVVDSNDHDRIEQVKEEIDRMLVEEQLKDVPLLIFANKMDLPRAMSTEKISELLDIKAISKSRLVYVQGCCATTGDGLAEGLNWLINVTTKPEKKENAKEEPGYISRLRAKLSLRS